MSDLVERAQQARNRRILGGLGGKPAEEAAILLADEVTALRSLVGETADEITRLQSALTEAQAQGEMLKEKASVVLREFFPKTRTLDRERGLIEYPEVQALREAVKSFQSTPPTAVARVIEAAQRIFPAWQEYLDNTSCGEMCDATYETQGCVGRCALEDGKKHAREATEALAALGAKP